MGVILGYSQMKNYYELEKTSIIKNSILRFSFSRFVVIPIKYSFQFVCWDSGIRMWGENLSISRNIRKHTISIHSYGVWVQQCDRHDSLHHHSKCDTIGDPWVSQRFSACL